LNALRMRGVTSLAETKKITESENDSLLGERYLQDTTLAPGQKIQGLLRELTLSCPLL
jgi:hypothetical protein